MPNYQNLIASTRRGKISIFLISIFSIIYCGLIFTIMIPRTLVNNFLQYPLLVIELITYFRTFIIGPILIIISLVVYIERMSQISRIPINSSLYEAIINPTIQKGPIKVIFLVTDEEELEP